MKTKLTLVSIGYEGRKLAAFVRLPVIRGKAVLDRKTFDAMRRDLDIRHGGTFTIA